jgi:hypothetical protein
VDQLVALFDENIVVEPDSENQESTVAETSKPVNRF